MLNKKNCSKCKQVFIPESKHYRLCDECRETTRTNNGLRFNILERDNFTCIYCGKSSVEDNVKLHADHIIPLTKGGNNDAFNMVTSCSDCNVGKGAKMLNPDNLKRILLIVEKRQLKKFR